MAEHSPEPWVANECGVDEFFICEESPPGAPGEDTGWGKQIGEIDGKANARRVVACVNALEGIPTEVLESGAVNKIVEALLSVPVGVLGPFPEAPLLEAFLNHERKKRHDA